MKALIINIGVVGVLGTLAIPSWSQSNFDAEVNAELDQMYKEVPAGSGASSNAGAAAGRSNLSNSAAPTVQVNVRNSGGAGLGQVQKQPTTVIEASPLTESRAERVRRERQEAELATEQKIVEKLEQSRIEDEKRRSEALFGDRVNNLNAAPAPVVVPVQQVQPVVQQVVEKTEPVVDIKDKKANRTEAGLIAGVPGYMNASNVRGNYSMGASFGRRIDNHLLAEGSFLFSNYELRQPDGVLYYGGFYSRVTNIDQYQGGMSLRYLFLEGVFRPNAGGTLQYSYRSYRDTRIAISNNEADSQAIDLGLVAGMDLDVTDKFTIGLDYKYFWNLTYRTSSQDFTRTFGGAYLGNSNPLEKLNAYQLLATLRWSFF